MGHPVEGPNKQGESTDASLRSGSSSWSFGGVPEGSREARVEGLGCLAEEFVLWVLSS